MSLSISGLMFSYIFGFNGFEFWKDILILLVMVRHICVYLFYMFGSYWSMLHVKISLRLLSWRVLSSGVIFLMQFLSFKVANWIRYFSQTEKCELCFWSFFLFVVKTNMVYVFCDPFFIVICYLVTGPYFVVVRLWLIIHKSELELRLDIVSNNWLCN